MHSDRAVPDRGPVEGERGEERANSCASDAESQEFDDDAGGRQDKFDACNADAEEPDASTVGADTNAVRLDDAISLEGECIAMSNPSVP